MQFLYPGFLFALFAVVIPLIIHLFRFRRYRKIYFSNVRLIEDLKLETQRKSRLKHILVLIARMLAIASLVFAFAQPYIPLRTEQQASPYKTVSIYIDNSFSMEAVAEDGTLLQIAKAKALEISNAYAITDQFNLITNDFEGRHQRLYSKEEFQEFVQSVEISPVSRSLPEILLRAKDLYASGEKKYDLHIISDFQRTMLNPQTFEVDSAVQLFFAPLHANAVSNLYIDSCWFESPVRYAHQVAKLNVRLRNVGDGDYEKVPLRIRLNGQQKAVASFDLAAGQEKIEQMSFRLEEIGWHSGAIEISDYPITYDDQFFLSFASVQRISILSIYQNSSSGYLRALFGNDSSFNYTSQDIQSLDYSKFGAWDLIILENADRISSGLASELRRFMEEGGSVLVFPGDKILTEDYTPFLHSIGMGRIEDLDTINSRVSDYNKEHPVFEGVFEAMEDNTSRKIDLPLVFSHYVLSQSAGTPGSVILQLENGRPFLMTSVYGKGNGYLFASSFTDNASSLPRHALVVPLLHRIAILSRPVTTLSYTIGKDQVVKVSGIETSAEVLKLKPQRKEAEIIPEIRKQGGDIFLFTHEQLKENGIYEITDQNRPIAYAAFNYDRRESELEYFSLDGLEAMIKDKQWENLRLLDVSNQSAAEAITALNQGERFWKWFIILALIFIFIEVILLRFMRA